MLTCHSGPDAADVAKAKEMCIELLESVQKNYEEFKERGPRGGGGSRNDHQGGGGGGGGYQQHDRNGSGSYGSGNGQQYGVYNQPQYASGAQSPQAMQPQGQEQQQQQMDPAQVAAWIQYYTANPQQDPYAQYGGYAAVMAQYYQDAQQQGGVMGQQAQGYAGSPTQQQVGGQNGGYGAPPGQLDGADEAPPPPPPPPGA